jgi:glucosyl-3-phosphoglycerate synthase
MPLTGTAPLPDASFVAEIEEFVALKGSTSVAVCIPARDEEATIAPVVAMCRMLQAMKAVDEVVVIDDHSEDETARIAKEHGAIVISNAAEPGKGEALQSGITSTTADIVVFLDADVTNISSQFVTRLVEPLLASAEVQLVKAAYVRPLNGSPAEGGRVTELVARPLLRRFFPVLADVAQPLAGECALRRSVVDRIGLGARYEIEIGLLIDVYRRFGRAAIVDADLGERVHRNRPLVELSGQADDVLNAVLARVIPGLGAPVT